jgi:hypothetical protein
MATMSASAATAVLLIARLALAQIDDPVGRVTMVVGEVRAERSNSSVALARRSEVYSGESITTSVDGHVQFRLTDSSLISLRCDSSFRILEFSFLDDPSEDTAVFQLLRGRVRMITGAVPSRNNQRFRLLVGDSEISVHGTDFEVFFDPLDRTVYLGVYDGGIAVTNEQGSAELGIDKAERFATIGEGEPPVAQTNQPAGSLAHDFQCR